MINLDDPGEIKKFDSKDVLGSTKSFVKQCYQIHEMLGGEDLIARVGNVESIVFAGMGGSAYGAYIVSGLFKNELEIPIYINNDYDLPGFVNDKTLVILTSYSGSTEEVLSCLQAASKKEAKILGFTSGGELAQTLKEQKLPLIVFDPVHNPSGQPRLGTGYLVLGTIDILRALGLIKVPAQVITDTLQYLDENSSRICEEAKALAKEVSNKIPMVFAGSFLSGNAHIIRNQLNETAKSISMFSFLPELNHHLMEGLKNPEDKHLTVLFLDSNLYSEHLKKRLSLTEEVIKLNNVESIKYHLEGVNKLEQVFEALLFGGFFSFFLAILYQQDPSVIPWVDYFKEKLSK